MSRNVARELTGRNQRFNAGGDHGLSSWLVALVALSMGCGSLETGGTAAALPALQAQELAAERREPVGLALEIEQGVGVPLRVLAGHEFYINQIDIRTAVAATVDEGVEGLEWEGDFAMLNWHGVRQVDEEPLLQADPNGTTYTRRRFYRRARWMEQSSTFTVRQVDEHGRTLGPAIQLNIGKDDERCSSDAFFIRRLGAIQWAYDCRSATDCSTSRNFLEEALVEVRNARLPARAFTLSPRTRALEVRWSLRASEPYLIPVEQVESAPYGYGFSMDIRALTPPGPHGTYAPGTAVTFQLTLKDGSGRPLHPAGSLPTYNEVISGRHTAGIQYYRAFSFIESTTTYYRRKHRERMLASQIIGPAHRIQPIRSIVGMGEFFGPSDVQTIGLPERDGVYSQARIFPQANHLFLGRPGEPSLWDAPVSDTWTYQLPANAEPGTYLVTLKGRRTYLGEDLPLTTTVEIQVGSPRRTQARLTTGPCNTCHRQGGELSRVLHGGDNRAACAGCHAPLDFELEGLVAVRTHFIHSRSDRVGQSQQRCSSCHLQKESIQRTSKAACLSCHKSYPASHVRDFGPLQSMYVGGGRESFQQCTTTCHTQHRGSGL
jgi:hypothetical protein